MAVLRDKESALVEFLDKWCVVESEDSLDCVGSAVCVEDEEIDVGLFARGLRVSSLKRDGLDGFLQTHRFCDGLGRHVNGKREESDGDDVEESDVLLDVNADACPGGIDE